MKISNRDPTNRRVTGIKSGRIKVWFGDISEDSEDDLGYNIKELPPFADFPDSKKYSYKFLGYTKNKKGEPIQIFSVRKRRKQKNKHLTLKWNATIKTKDIIDIDNNEDYKLVTVRLGLPKATIRNLKNGFNKFLNPKSVSIKHNPDTNQILEILETERYAFGIIRMLFETDEINVSDIMRRFNLSKPGAINHLNKLERLDIIVSDSTRHNKRIYMLKLEKEEMKKIIKEYFE